MFFLAFILFAVLIVWLVMNGLNEMRWVQAHSHDEEVANDKGIIPSMSEVSEVGTKIKQKTSSALEDDGVIGQAKQKFKDGDYVNKAKDLGKNAGEKLKEGDYVNKAKDLGKNAGEKLKDGAAAARSRVDDMRN